LVFGAGLFPIPTTHPVFSTIRQLLTMATDKIPHNSFDTILVLDFGSQ
jgi:hypothetical protein